MRSRNRRGSHWPGLRPYRPPYAEQESEELPDETVARLNPDAREVENLEVRLFSTRRLRTDLFELPARADLRLTGTGSG